MKKSRILNTTLLVIVLFFVSTAKGQKLDILRLHQSEQPSVAAVFANRVNLRESPNTKSKVLAKLELGELVEVIERTKIISTIDGKTDHWFKVKTGYYSGYLWGGLLARYVVKSESNASISFLLKTTDETNNLRIKVVKNHVLMQDFEFEGMVGNEQLYGMYTQGSKGMNDIKDLLAIKYIGEFCGATSGESILAWDGSQLHQFISVGRAGDGGYSMDEWLVFPSDLLGENNLLHFYHSEEYMEDESGEEVLVVDKKEHLIYRWDGERLILI